VDLLEEQGIKSLYGHQGVAHDLIRAGKNVLVATPTASGKSMVYNLPVIQSILEDMSTRALYLFPLKALAQDQQRVLKNFEPLFVSNTLPKPRVLAALYDGDTSTTNRQKIRKNPPNIIITNPDMLHLSFLPYHAGWKAFLNKLRYIIIDEVHTYRGVFGSHMAWVVKRLLRILKRYGVEPVFILLSATIGNPKQFGEKLIGQELHCVLSSSAPRPERNMLFLNPSEGNIACVSHLLEAALKRGLRSIVYTGSRKMAELITMWTKQRLGSLAPKLSSYRSGFLAIERRQIEHDLSSGKLLGVISTSALELGIDIGDLDICILAGYPGSIMATWQRGGRVGRGMNESAVILVAQEDALDQYYMQNYNDFFEREMESAILNPENLQIVAQHLHCAAAEHALQVSELASLSPEALRGVKELAHQGTLIRGYGGQEWFATEKFPQRQVSLRGSGRQWQVIRQDNGEIFGEIDSERALYECHEGAIYLHSSKTWHVERCDTENGEVLVKPFQGSYFTRPVTEKDTDILEVFERKNYLSYGVSLGKIRVRERITGYQKVNKRSGKIVDTLPLDLPEQQLETVGLWLEIPESVKDVMEQDAIDFLGSIHALEHAMIGILPLLVLCDRNDIGGVSCPWHHQTPGPVIFIYDGYAGGMGLCNDAFNRIGELLRQTAKTVESCKCDQGCPSCVHSPKCGSGNRPIDKEGCGSLLALLKST
jgi:DEAD/DEAH box helicase domain-containing protein